MLAPSIQTARFILRPFSEADSKRVQILAGNPLIAATTGAVPHPYKDGMAEAWISQHQERFSKGTSHVFAITLKTTGELVGCIDLLEISKENRRAEMGYWVGVDFWNQGICTEAGHALLHYAFHSLNLNRVQARHMSSNPASGKVMQKLGMKHEGCLRQHMMKNGEFVDIEVYGILREEFKEK
jgi:RimJ/RimL family protein N-acetyltransferase